MRAVTAMTLIKGTPVHLLFIEVNGNISVSEDRKIEKGYIKLWTREVFPTDDVSVGNEIVVGVLENSLPFFYKLRVELVPKIEFVSYKKAMDFDEESYEDFRAKYRTSSVVIAGLATSIYRDDPEWFRASAALAKALVAFKYEFDRCLIAGTIIQRLARDEQNAINYAFLINFRGGDNSNEQ